MRPQCRHLGLHQSHSNSMVSGVREGPMDRYHWPDLSSLVLSILQAPG